MDLARLVKTHENTDNEQEKNELVDRIKTLQEIILEEARFDVSSNGIKSTNELNSKLQDEIDRLQIQLANERNEKYAITQDKYLVYEKLRESEISKHNIKNDYESVIKTKSDAFKEIIERLQAELDTEKSKNNDLKSSLDLKKSKLNELNSRILHLNQIYEESKDALRRANLNLAEEILNCKKIKSDSEKYSEKIFSFEKDIQDKITEMETLQLCNRELTTKSKDLELEYEKFKISSQEDKANLEGKIQLLENKLLNNQNELNRLNNELDKTVRKNEEIKNSLKSLEEIKISLELQVKELDGKNNILTGENLKKDFIIRKHKNLLENFDKVYNQYLLSFQKLTENAYLAPIDEKKTEDLLYESILCSTEFEEKTENNFDLKRKSKEDDNTVTTYGKKSPEPKFSNEKSQMPIQVKYNKKYKCNNFHSSKGNFCEDKLEDFNFE